LTRACVVWIVRAAFAYLPHEEGARSGKERVLGLGGEAVLGFGGAAVPVLAHMHERRPRRRHHAAAARALQRGRDVQALAAVGRRDERRAAQRVVAVAHDGRALGGEAVLVHVDRDGGDACRREREREPGRK